MCLLYRPGGRVRVLTAGAPLMFAIAVVVLTQRLLPPHPAVDVSLALAIAALGVAIAAP